MNLAIDIGNSYVKYGVYDNDRLVTFGKMLKDETEFDLLKKYEITGAAISSVVPHKVIELKDLIKKTFKVDAYIITNLSKFNLKLEYRTPETLGMDRLCGAEGAIIQQKKDYNDDKNNEPIIVIDFGTATTINLVKPGGIFSGGIIAPGIDTMIHSLFNKTAQLPFIDLNDYHEFVGKDTVSCIASGIMNSTVGLIEKAIERIQKDFNTENVTIYLSGGNATLIKPYLKYNSTIVNDLVLKGVNEVYKLNL